ncbi:serine/threonine protein kinase [Azohydromonas sp.]|uniref:serine/threonine protein kinase n=1 Tax=Azohydromonas sp. TaxID=1872666 RepID=UPI002B94A45F|nr:serine/threonine protein kinase [Azohydromonas sp.]HMM84419.1 serine/threonine protein kinase [Azohydromonas sp.]
MNVSRPAAAVDGYAALTPDAVLDALAGAGLHPDGRLLQLNSYENRVFQVFLDDGTAVVAKFYRPHRWSDAQILEEHAFALELAAHDVPVVAPLALRTTPSSAGGCMLAGTPATLAADLASGFRFSVSPRHAGRSPELDDPAVAAWLGRFIGRLHAVGARQRFAHRRSLDVASWGDASRQWLVDHDVVTPAELGAWRAAADAALALVHAAFARLSGLRVLRLHGDCHLGNILWRDEGPHVVDLDDACNGPAVQDLWMLEPEGPQRTAAWAALLDGYRVFMPFDDRELALIEPLRTLRMLHHSAWIARRWSDPAFPVAFPWFGTPAYWSQQATQLREQVELMSG